MTACASTVGRGVVGGDDPCGDGIHAAVMFPPVGEQPGRQVFAAVTFRPGERGRFGMDAGNTETEDKVQCSLDSHSQPSARGFVERGPLACGGPCGYGRLDGGFVRGFSLRRQSLQFHRTAPRCLRGQRGQWSLRDCHQQTVKTQSEAAPAIGLGRHGAQSSKAARAGKEESR